MPTRHLAETANLVLHVMNRGVRRLRLFDQRDDYEAFLRVVAEGRRRTGIRILAYCVMPNHFHLVVWPRNRGQLPDFMQWFQGTHSKRWHRHRCSLGTGAVYQGRYRAFPVQSDRHFLTVCRYVERNPVRAKLVKRAEDWPWSSLASDRRNGDPFRTDEWPILPPETWVSLVNVPMSSADLDALRVSIARGIAFGDDGWATAVDTRLATRGRRLPGRPARRLQNA